MFLDQTETLIERGYGKDSSAWSVWKILKPQLHSSHLGHDLLYAGRNSLHTAAVPLKITVAASEIAPDEVRQRLVLTLDAKVARGCRTQSLVPQSHNHRHSQATGRLPPKR